MNFEDATNTRLNFYETRDGKTIKIPARRNWFLIPFLTFWLAGWTIGGLVAMSVFFTGLGNFGFDSFFLLFWLGGWAAGWIYVSYTLTWMLFGYEKITVGNGGLSGVRVVLFYSKQKDYRLGDVRRLRWSEVKMSSMNLSSRLHGGKGMLEFDYGPKTIVIATGLDSGEGHYVMKALGDAAAPYKITE